MRNPWKDITPYTKEDAGRFKGRDEDIRKFTNILQYSSFSVLYAESGIGKTSFINAGITPVFSEKGYKDIVINFPTEIYEGPAESFRERIESFICEKLFGKGGLQEVSQDDMLPETEGVLRKSLWWRLHAYVYKDVADGEERRVKPLIIFDQFEEVFKKTTTEMRQDMFALFSELYSKLPSERLQKILEEDEEHQDDLYDRIDDEIRFKVLFSLRKEYLAEFDHWTNMRFSLPELLQNRMLLQPFTRAQAEEVITMQTLDGEPVTTLNLIKDEILLKFEHRNGTGKAFDMTFRDTVYEAFLLSVICSRLYEMAEAKGGVQLTPSDVETLTISSLILDFYEKTIHGLKIPIPRQHLKVIEEELVDEYGDRNRVKIGTRNLKNVQFESRYKEELESAHVVKISDGYVELIHDRLAEAIFNKRKEKNKRLGTLLLRWGLVVLIVLLGWAALSSGWKKPGNYRLDYYTTEKEFSNEIHLPKDSTSFERMPRSFVTRVIIDNDAAHQKIGYDFDSFVNLTDFRIVGKQTTLENNIVIDRCEKLVDIVLSDSLETIPTISFCPNLHFLRLPANIETIPEGSFEGMDVEIEVPKNASDKFAWIEGVLWSLKDKKIVYARSDAEQHVHFPDEIQLDSIKYRDLTFINKDTEPELIIEYRQRDYFYDNQSGMYYKKWVKTLVAAKLYKEENLDLSQPPYDSIAVIDAAVFRDCKYLRSIILPSKLKEIKAEAFRGCTSLREVCFPDSIVSIGNDAFAGCCDLTEIRLPVVEFLGDGVFRGCSRLKEVHLSSIKEIKKHQYGSFTKGGDKLYDVELYTQFNGCELITFKVPPQSEEFVKDSSGILFHNKKPVFYNEVQSIPDNYTYIDSCFYFKNGYVYHWSFTNKSGEDFIIAAPKKRLEISDDKKTVIVNPDSVEYISGGRYLFYNPQKLSSLHIANCSLIPFLGDVNGNQMSDDDKSHITVYVPWGCRKYYELDPAFSSFKEIREDSWSRRLWNLLTEMYENSIGEMMHYPWMKYAGIFVVLAVMGFIYALQFKKLSRQNIQNHSNNRLRLHSMLSVIVITGVFVLAWIVVYWLFFFNTVSLINSDASVILGHVFGISFGVLAVRVIVFYKADWTVTKRNLLDFMGHVRHMTLADWKQAIIVTVKNMVKSLKRTIRTIIRSVRKMMKFLFREKKVIGWSLIGVVGLGIILMSLVKWHGNVTRSLEKAQEMCDTQASCMQADSLLHADLPKHTIWLTNRQKRKLREIYAMIAEKYDILPIEILEDNTLKGHNSTVNSVNFSPDGKYVVTGSWDDTAMIWGWDGNRTTPLDTLKGHNSSVYSVNFSPDGKYVVTGSGDKTATIWEVQTASAVAVLGFGNCKISPDGKYKVIHGGQTVFVIDRSGLITETLHHPADIRSVSFSPDGSKIVVTGGEEVGIWSTHGDKVGSFVHKDVDNVLCCLDGEHFVSHSKREAYLWDRMGNRIDSLAKDRDNAVYHLSPKEKYFVFYSHVYRMEKGDTLILNYNLYKDIISVHISSDGKHIMTEIVPTSADKKMRTIIWRSDGTFERYLLSYKWFVDLTYSEDGNYIYGRYWGDEGVCVFDAKFGAFLGYLRDGERIISCGNGDFVLINGPHYQRMRFLSLDALKEKCHKYLLEMREEK